MQNNLPEIYTALYCIVGIACYTYVKVEGHQPKTALDSPIIDSVTVQINDSIN